MRGESRHRSTNATMQRWKTLRIWITNTAEDQAWQINLDSIDSLDFHTSGIPSYRVKMEGHLVDDEDDLENEEAPANEPDKMENVEDDKPQQQASKAPKHRFSFFFSEMTVEFPPHMPASDQTTVHWKKPEIARAAGAGAGAGGAAAHAGADFDELTFKRVGDENMNIVIKLTRQEDPERYLLTHDLAEIIDMKEATATEVMMGLWEYIKINKLQDHEDKRNFRCDELLRRVLLLLLFEFFFFFFFFFVFCCPACHGQQHRSPQLTNTKLLLSKVLNRETSSLPALPEQVIPHFRPLPPVCLPYTIRVDQAFHSNKTPTPTIYDVLVPIDDSLRSKLIPFMRSPSYSNMLKEVAVLDDQLALIIQAMHHSKAKHSFLTNLAGDPVRFVKKWTSSQKRDIEYIMGEGTRGRGNSVLADEWRKSGREGVWGSENAREGVGMMLAKGGGGVAPGAR